MTGMDDAVTDPVAPRRGRPGYDQETVLRRAIEVFNRQGYEGTSMGDLARELGLTKSAIYHHVPSKEHLLAAALDEALDGLAAAIDGAVDGAGPASAADRLRTAVEQSVEVLVDHLPAVTLLLRVHGNTPTERWALERRREFDRIVADLVAQAAAQGDVRTDVDATLVSRLLFGMINSLVEWYRPGQGGGAGAAARGTSARTVGARELADAVVRLAFDGLRR